MTLTFRARAVGEGYEFLMRARGRTHWGMRWESRGGGQNPSWPGPILCGERGAWKAVSRGRKGVRTCTHNFTGTNLVIFNELTKKWGRKRKNGGGIVTKTKRLRQRKRKL